MGTISDKDGTPPFEIKTGEWIQHTGSKAYYQYHGITESTGLHVISSSSGQDAYTIPTESLEQYYTKTSSPHTTILVPNHKYCRTTASRAGLVYHVQAIFTNPINGKKEAFAWVHYPSGNLYPTIIPESMFSNFTEIR